MDKDNSFNIEHEKDELEKNSATNKQSPLLLPTKTVKHRKGSKYLNKKDQDKDGSTDIDQSYRNNPNFIIGLGKSLNKLKMEDMENKEEAIENLDDNDQQKSPVKIPEKEYSPLEKNHVQTYETGLDKINKLNTEEGDYRIDQIVNPKPTVKILQEEYANRQHSNVTEYSINIKPSTPEKFQDDQQSPEKSDNGKVCHGPKQNQAPVHFIKKSISSNIIQFRPQALNISLIKSRDYMQIGSSLKSPLTKTMGSPRDKFMSKDQVNTKNIDSIFAGGQNLPKTKKYLEDLIKSDFLDVIEPFIKNQYNQDFFSNYSFEEFRDQIQIAKLEKDKLLSLTFRYEIFLNYAKKFIKTKKQDLSSEKNTQQGVHSSKYNEEYLKAVENIINSKCLVNLNDLYVKFVDNKFESDINWDNLIKPLGQIQLKSPNKKVTMSSTMLNKKAMTGFCSPGVMRPLTGSKGAYVNSHDIITKNTIMNKQSTCKSVNISPKKSNTMNQDSIFNGSERQQRLKLQSNVKPFDFDPKPRTGSSNIRIKNVDMDNSGRNFGYHDEAEGNQVLQNIVKGKQADMSHTRRFSETGVNFKVRSNHVFPKATESNIVRTLKDEKQGRSHMEFMDSLKQLGSLIESTKPENMRGEGPWKTNAKGNLM